MMRTISELKAKVAVLTAEPAEHKPVRGQLCTGDLDEEDCELRSKLRKYEDIIPLEQRNQRGKTTAGALQRSCWNVNFGR